MKKLFTIMLSFILSLCLPATTAMAAENTNPEVIRHTIELSIKPGEETILSNGDYGVMPAIWNQNSYTLRSGSVTYTAQFNVPQRYFAYEISATASNGTAINETYSVHFVRSVTATISGISAIANGSTVKNDWITIDNTNASDYQFKINNTTSTTITVKIVYYSWA